MNKAFNFNNTNLKNFLSIFTFILCIIIFTFSFTGLKHNRGYFLFIEFNDAYGLKEGTSVNLRGVKIGYVRRITIHLNKVVVLLNIKTQNILIHKNSIFQATQVGLFNDIVVTITPLDYIKSHNFMSKFILSRDCKFLSAICPNSYVKGYKGINYDDLIRATTRISQRFDDPRFFNLFYLLLKNVINISDELFLLINDSSVLLYLCFELMNLIVLKFPFL
uniref:Mce/MlaD domain-containing protein n=1 Tax=Symphyocladiella dendroidea TaxID=2506487 RepID=A0A1Z1M766_9FLOR|nr:hypothetical protein [Symphyocladiella dendroidea]ARW61829.1 hypothetical protein [Symphyocladiella dendroidea]